MEKIKKILNYISGTNLALLALFIYLPKVVLLDINIADSIVCIALAALYGYSLYLKQNEYKPLEQSEKDRIKHIENKINALTFNPTSQARNTSWHPRKQPK